MDKEILALWLDLHAELKVFILSRVADAQAGEDILQDVFIQVHENVHTLNNPARLTSWIYQITRNLIVDYFRSQKVSVSEMALVNLAEHEADEPLYTKLSVCINTKIDQLSEKYKHAILLTTFQQHSQKELAAYLGISYSGAKTRVQRAREVLREAIVDCRRVETDVHGKIIDYDHL